MLDFLNNDFLGALMFIIPCNYGNETVALIQWAKDNGLTDVHCLYVDTGWASPEWPERVALAEKWVEEIGFNPITLKPKADFPTLIREQGKFPTTQFQWCASFLKALPMLEYLDFDLDPEYQSTVLLARRKAASRANFNLEKRVEGTEHYSGRPIEHSILDLTDEERDTLINKSGLPIIEGRSMECAVCTNFVKADIERLQVMSGTGPAATDDVSDPHVEFRDNFGGSGLLDGSCGLKNGCENILVSVKTLEFEIGGFERAPESESGMGCGDPFSCGA